MKKVLVTGGHGQLAKCFKREASERLNVVFTSKAQLDICEEDDWDFWLSREHPDVVLHTAAYTDVAGAETAQDQARRLNVDAVRLAARKCRMYGARFLLISTDYVFDGSLRRPYRPDDPPSPLSVYGSSKADGERTAFEENPDTLVVRVSWLYSPYGKNFMLTMLRLFAEREEVKVVNDQVASPTCGLTFANYLKQFILNDPPAGIYHFSLSGEASWYDFAKAICEDSGGTARVEPVNTAAFPSNVSRPAYSKLDATSFEKVVGESLPPWRNAVTYCLHTHQNEHNN